MKLIPFSVLVGGNGALLLGIAVLWSVGSSNWAVPEASLPDHLSLRAPRIERVAAPAEALPQTLQRPLFAQSRRPPPPVAEVAVETPPEPDPLQDVLLLGVFTVGGEKHLMLRAEGKVSRLKQGDSFGPWKVGALSENAAVFQRGSENRKLELKRAAQPAARAPVQTRRLPLQRGGAVAPEPAPGGDEADSNAAEPVGQEQQLQEAPSAAVPAAAARTARTLAERTAAQRGAR